MSQDFSLAERNRMIKLLHEIADKLQTFEGMMNKDPACVAPRMALNNPNPPSRSRNGTGNRTVTIQSPMMSHAGPSGSRNKTPARPRKMPTQTPKSPAERIDTRSTYRPRVVAFYDDGQNIEHIEEEIDDVTVPLRYQSKAMAQKRRATTQASAGSAKRARKAPTKKTPVKKSKAGGRRGIKQKAKAQKPGKGNTTLGMMNENGDCVCPMP